MIPKCFSQPNTVSRRASHQIPHSLVTCIYRIQISNTPSYLTLTWAKTLFSHSVTIHLESFSTTVSLYPSTFSLFRSHGHGSKSIYLSHKQCNQRVKLHWDFTKAEFTNNSAEPERSFYIAISCKSRLEFLLGDLYKDLARRSGLVVKPEGVEQPGLLSRREHVFGQKSYISRAMFLGSMHEIEIECNGGALVVKVDGVVRLVVKRLAWKFRGNERIFVGGIEVEFFWDVLNWVNDKTCVDHDGSVNGKHGVFIFQVGDHCGVWPEMVGLEKRLIRKTLSCTSTPPTAVSLSPSPSCSSVLQWAEESSDCGRSSCSSSTTRSSGSSGGFSLLLYAWKE